MEHDDAMTLMAAEKYILGELPDEEREQFEEHFFRCEECAQEVRDLSSVTQGARELLKEPPEPEASTQRASGRWLERGGWLERLPLWFAPGRLAWGGAMAALLVFASYQTVQLRRAARPQAVASFFVHPESRGEATTVPVEKLGAFLLLEADLPGASGRVQWDLRKSEGKEIIVQDAAAAPPPGESFKVLLPSSFLPPAEYTLTVRPATVTAEKPWLFRFKVSQNLR